MILLRKVSSEFMAIIAFHLMLLGLVVTMNVRKDYKHPVILIPGLGGSRILYREINETNGTFRVGWVNNESLFDVNQLIDKIGLIYSKEFNRSFNVPGVETLVPGWGDTSIIENLDDSMDLFRGQFDRVVKALLNDPFFKRTVNIRGAPYDFRKPMSENKSFRSKLQSLVEETYYLNQCRKVILVGYSFGGLYGMEFLQSMDQAWKRKHIQSFVSVGAPYGGLVQALKAIVSGADFGVLPSSPGVRQLVRTFPTAHYLLPDKRVWDVTEILVQTPDTNYTLGDLQKLYEDLGIPDAYEIWQQNQKSLDFHQAFSGVNDVYCVYGTGVETPKKLIYERPSLENFFSQFPDQSPNTEYDDGDGVVNLRSLQLCKHFNNIVQVQLPKATHPQLLQDPRFVNFLVGIAG